MTNQPQANFGPQMQQMNMGRPQQFNPGQFQMGGQQGMPPPNFGGQRGGLPQQFGNQPMGMQPMRGPPPMGGQMGGPPPMGGQMRGPPPMGGQPPMGRPMGGPMGSPVMGGQRTIIDEESSSTTSEEFVPYGGGQEIYRDPVIRSPPLRRESFIQRAAASPPPIRIIGASTGPILPGVRNSYTTSYYDALRRPPYAGGLYQSIVHEDLSRRSLANPPVVVGSVIRPELRQVGVVRSDVLQAPPPPPQAPPMVARTLLIRPVAARLTHNTHFFLKKMNPFIEVLVGPQRYKTAMNKRGGKRPQWNETFTHQLIGNEAEMTVIVWDQHRRRVALVGETRINLSEVLAQGKSSNWYELFWKGKPAGRVLLNLEIA